MKRNDLDIRMKEYEAVSKNYLTRRIPVIIRIDGRAFHTFTKKFIKPFDTILMQSMQLTMKYLCENIQGCVLGYTQSDEITLVLCDYQSIDSAAWFDYKVHKITSVSASMATLEFNRQFYRLVQNYKIASAVNCTEDSIKQLAVYERAIEAGATFDARAFNLPINEVVNNLIWRQQDATKNSIQMVARYLFPQKELYHLNGDMLQEKMFKEAGINWNNFDTDKKRGACCIKKDIEVNGIIRGKWVIDKEIPIFTKDREYVTSRITF